MRRIIDIQINAINRYIDKLIYCEDNNINRKEAYKMIVDELRKENGLKPLSREHVNPKLKKFIGCCKNDK